MYSTKNPYENVGGLAEVAALIGRQKQTVGNWIRRGTPETPKPLATLAATQVWDLDEWRSWAKKHTDLVHWSELEDPKLVHWAKVHPDRVKDVT
jgi:hypothetical protein